MPAADSINVPVVVVPRRAPTTVAKASASSGLSMSGRLPFSSSRSARAPRPIRAAMVSTKSMMKTVRMTEKNPQVRAPLRSILNQISVSGAGVLKISLGAGEIPKSQPAAAVPRMPMSMPPGTFLLSIRAIARNPAMARPTEGWVRMPTFTGASGIPKVTMPVSTSPIRVRKRPMPAPKAYFKELGMALASQPRVPERVRMTKRKPPMKTAPKAVCQVCPMTLTTVKAIKAFSPM